MRPVGGCEASTAAVGRSARAVDAAMSDPHGPPPAPGEPPFGPRLPTTGPSGKRRFYITSEGVFPPGDEGGLGRLVTFFPNALAPQTFGDLTRLLWTLENSHTANRATVARAGERYGEHTALEGYAMIESDRRNWFVRLNQRPGVRDVGILCDFRQLPFTAPSLKTLVAELCVNGGLSEAEVWALTIPDAAARLQTLLSPPKLAADPRKPPRMATGADTGADTQRKKKVPPPKTAAELLRVHKLVRRRMKEGDKQKEAVREYVEKNYPKLNSERAILLKVAALIRYLSRYSEWLEASSTTHNK
jgi:hypothetical protein